MQPKPPFYVQYEKDERVYEYDWPIEKLANYLTKRAQIRGIPHRIWCMIDNKEQELNLKWP